MSSTYLEFFKAGGPTDEEYKMLLKVKAERQESVFGSPKHRFVFLVIGSERSILAVHRLQPDDSFANLDRADEFIAFSGDVDSLTCYTLPKDIFQTSKGPAATIDQLKTKFSAGTKDHEDEEKDPKTANDATGAEDNKDKDKDPKPANDDKGADMELARASAWKLSLQEKAVTMSAVLVPPALVSRLLTVELSPLLLSELLTEIVNTKDHETYGRFVDWVRRALTEGGGLPEVAFKLPDGDSVEWKKMQLTQDVPLYRPDLRFDVIPLTHIVQDGAPGKPFDFHVIYSPGSVAHTLFKWSTKYDFDSGIKSTLDPAVCALLGSAPGSVNFDVVPKNNPDIDEGKLVEIIEKHKGSVDWAKYAIKLMKERPHMMCPIPSEMFMQQLVFSHVAGLFYSFSPSAFCSDVDIESCELLVQADGSGQGALKIRPDAGIKVLGLAKSVYLLCMMELKNEKDMNKEDMSKSVYFTVVSALAFRDAGFKGTIHVPFVIGSNERAWLYVTVLQDGSNIPEVKFVYGADLAVPAFRIYFTAHLTALLDLVFDAVNSKEWSRVPTAIQRKPIPMGKPFNTCPHSERSCHSVAESQFSSGQRTRSVGASGTGFQLAMSLASALGVVDLQNLSQYAGSPYILRGFHQGSSVILKIWQQGDELTDLDRIRFEIRLLKRAHNAGVPCPGVVDRLTHLDWDHGQERFHVLAMPMLANSTPEEGDLDAFAESLIESVVKLHSAGILHCDIKPDNVVWDKVAKVASLVDFGHAQEEEGARSYMGTEGYTSLRIQLKREPHSRLTEGYSVGKTLFAIAKEGSCSQVKQVAQQLCSEELTLESAHAFWERTATGSIKIKTQTTPPSVMAPVNMA
jgi:Protein kinase domain